MSKLGDAIRTMRLSRGMSQQALADELGVSRSTVGMYEQGSREPNLDTIEAIADVFNVPIAALVDSSEQRQIRLPINVMPMSDIQPHRVPLIGSVAAGVPILAEESYDLYIDAPSKADYALRVEGDSMEPTYLNGDVIYIRQQPDVLDGQVGVVLTDDSATLKHIYHKQNGLLLISDNPKYPPMEMTFDDYSTIQILGIPCGYTRMFNNAQK